MAGFGEGQSAEVHRSVANSAPNEGVFFAEAVAARNAVSDDAIVVDRKSSLKEAARRSIEKLNGNRLVAKFNSKNVKAEHSKVFVSMRLASSPMIYNAMKFEFISNIISKVDSKRAAEIANDENVLEALEKDISDILVLLQDPSKNEVQLNQKKDSFKEKLLGRKPTADENKDLDLYLGSSLTMVGKVSIMEKLSQLANLDPVLRQKLGDYDKELDAVQKDMADGKITLEEAFKRFNEILAKAVNDSGDEDLKKLLKDQKEEEEKQKKAENEYSPQETYSDAGGTSMPEVYGVMNDAGLNVQMRNGEMYVPMNDDNDNFYFTIREKKDSEGKKYYLKDKYSGEGESGPYKSEDLLKAADERHIDGYLTYELTKLDKKSVNNTNNPNDIKDGVLINIGKKLIGEGKDRNFRIDKMQMDVLKGVAALLVFPDAQTSRLDARSYNLSMFFNTLEKSNLEYYEKKFATQIPNVSVTEFIKKKDF